MNLLDIDNKIVHSLKYNHLALCIFSQHNFFEKSCLATSTKFLLNWKTTLPKPEKDPEVLPQSLYVSNLYNKTFPILIFTEQKKTEGLTKYFQGLLDLVAGLCTHNYESVVEIEEPKMMVLIDPSLEKNYQDSIRKACKGATSKIETPYFSSQNSFSIELLDFNRP